MDGLILMKKKIGYIKNVIVRVDKKIYMKAKYLATFIAGGLAMIIPMLFNMILSCLYSNLAVPDILYGYVCMFHRSFGSDLFYTHPFVFCVLYLGIDFIFCGLVACSCMALSFFCNKRFIVLLFPFFFFLAIDYVRWYFAELSGINIEISPMRFLHPTAYPQKVSGWLILVWIVGLLGITLGISFIKGKRDDVF